jgi:hypothetical protein
VRLEAEAEVLFKNKATVSAVTSEEEDEAERLKEMFPDFSHEFTDILMRDQKYRDQQELAQEAAQEAARGQPPAPTGPSSPQAHAAAALAASSFAITDDDLVEMYRLYRHVYSVLAKAIRSMATVHEVQ